MDFWRIGFMHNPIFPIFYHSSPFPSPQRLPRVGRGRGGEGGKNVRGKFSDLKCKNLSRGKEWKIIP
jgi:hypothetical protein